MDLHPKEFLRRLFDEAVAAALPEECVPANLPAKPKGRTIVIGAGKASAAMAAAVERHWGSHLEGLVITRYGFGQPCDRIDIVEASHPVPDQAGLDAALDMLRRLEGLTEDDLVICLISGGGSALLTLPADGIAFADKQAVNAMLLRCGATITEINTIRKHMSAIKGGRLARACAPAKLVSLIISDVPGDDPSVVASGPTVPDKSTFADVARIVAKYDLDLPVSVKHHFEAAEDESPGPDDPAFDGNEVKEIAAARQSLDAAAEAAKGAGITPIILGDDLEGEARDVGRDHARRALAQDGPIVILSGGETTVTVDGSGKGGRNTEFLLGLLLELDGAAHIHAIACDTDGIDGSEDNAGAYVGPDTLARAREAGLDLEAYLADNDAYSFFQALDDLIITGPTYTNVNDFRAILVLPR